MEAVTDLTFRELNAQNIERCDRHFHPVWDWSPTDWACALAGEVGETCNLIKKLRRLSPPVSTITPRTKSKDALPELLIPQIADELGDCVIYLDLLATRLGLSLETCVRNKFNEISQQIDANEKI